MPRILLGRSGEVDNCSPSSAAWSGVGGGWPPGVCFSPPPLQPWARHPQKLLGQAFAGQSGWTPGTGTQGGDSGACFRVSRCYQWGQDRVAVHRAPLSLTSHPGRVPHARRRCVRLCPSLISRGQHQASSSPLDLATACPQPAPVSSSLAGLCSGGQ